MLKTPYVTSTDLISFLAAISDLGQVKWLCEAQFKRGVGFDQLNVSCETWPGTVPAQGYVIDGSCGLRYTLRRV